MKRPTEAEAGVDGEVKKQRTDESSEEKKDVSSNKKFFDENGYLVVKGFASKEECEGMMARMDSLIEEWDPTVLEIFTTGIEQTKAQGSSDYFLDSADRIHFFLEPKAVDPDTKGLKKGLNKKDSINKVGHGLHSADPVFKKYSNSDKVTKLVRELGWQKPVLPQSMYIFKQAVVGDAVTSHQDSTFLHTTPRQSCLGLWLALQDASLENGCLWARPGSHKEPVRRHFYRNPVHFDEGDSKAPQMLFRDLVGKEDLKPWEGVSLDTFDIKEVGFVPVPIKQGDLFVIHGQVDHLSLPNTSEKSRHTFQLHLVEGPEAGVTWSPKNWLQLPKGKVFPAL